MAPKKRSELVKAVKYQNILKSATYLGKKGERKLSELEFAGIRFLPLFEEIGNCHNWNLSESEFVRIGICQNRNLSESAFCHFLKKLEFVRVGIFQNWKLSELEIVRIGNCQNRNLSESEFVRFGICQNRNL